MAVKFQLRRDTAANWTANNPILSEGEPGIETDTYKVKLGDGTTPWNSLSYTLTKDFPDIINKPTTLSGYGITDNVSSLANDAGYLTSTISSAVNITDSTASTTTTTGALKVAGGVGVVGTVTAGAFTGNVTGNLLGNVIGTDGTTVIVSRGTNTATVTGTVSSLSNHDTGDLAEGVNEYFTQSRARGSISVTDSGGDGSLSYDSGTGVITYTGPSATEVRAHFSGGTGVTITNGSISIGQAVGTTSSVTFNSITGNVFTSLIDSSDSSAITITPDVVMSAGLTVGNHIVPSSDINIDLGTPEKRFRDLYLSGNTIFLGSAVISTEGDSIRLPPGSSIGDTEITTYVDNAIAGLINAAPAALDTLNELAAALGNDSNFSTTITTALSGKAPLNSPTFTGTVSGVTATHVGLGNVTNESKATMFTNPTFTGTVSGVTATHVGLGNVTNESKATMFTNPTFTGSTNAGVTTITGNASTGEGVLTIKNGSSGYELVFSVVDSWSIESKDILSKGWPIDFTASRFSFSTTDPVNASTAISIDAVVINNDGSVDIAGNLDVSGTLSLTNALSVSNGGTGATTKSAALTNLLPDDPNADRLLYWDDSAGAATWLSIGTGLVLDGGTNTLTATGQAYSQATSSDLGLIKLGSDTAQTTAANAVTSTASRTYALQVNASGQAVVNVPWVDTNTTYSQATSSVLGLIKLGSDTAQTTAANAVTSTASRTYAVQANASGQAVVNVPWVDTDTNTTYSQATSSVLGLIKLGSDTAQTTAANAVTSTASRTYAVQVNASGQAVVNVPWVDTDTNTTYSQATSSVLGLIKLASDTQQTTAPNAVTSTSSRTYAVQVNASGQAVVNVPWVDTDTNTTYSQATTTTLGLIRLGSDTAQTTTPVSVTSTASRTYAVQANLSGQAVVNVPWEGADITSGSTSARFNALGVGTAASTTTGEIRATNNITAYYSDDRLKTRLGNIENALEKVCSLTGFYYQANDLAQSLGYDPVREVGLSAQDMQKILPEIVVPAPIDEKYLTLRYEKTIPLLVEAIKDIKKLIDELRSEINNGV